MNPQMTIEKFNEITKNFERHILHHDGLYRHIRYIQPKGTPMRGDMYWEVITWPGCATIRGDYGTSFTIERNQDMLDFFSHGCFGNPNAPEFDYWMGKVTSGKENCTTINPAILRDEIIELIHKSRWDINSYNAEQIANAFYDEISGYNADDQIGRLADAEIDLDYVELECEAGCENSPGGTGYCECEPPTIQTITDIDEDWWETIRGETYTRDWEYACYALLKTGREWKSMEPQP